METAQYDKLTRFARRQLPFSSHLDPRDLVNDAYLLLLDSDENALRRIIVSLAYKERTYCASRLPYSETPLVDNQIVLTSKVCRRCGLEKGLRNFPHQRNQCHACTSQLRRPYQKRWWWANRQKNRDKNRNQCQAYRDKRRADPARYAAYLAKTKANYQALKADPERYAAYCASRRQTYHLMKKTKKNRLTLTPQITEDWPI